MTHSLRQICVASVRLDRWRTRRRRRTPSGATGCASLRRPSVGCGPSPEATVNDPSARTTCSPTRAASTSPRWHTSSPPRPGSCQGLLRAWKARSRHGACSFRRVGSIQFSSAVDTHRHRHGVAARQVAQRHINCSAGSSRRSNRAVQVVFVGFAGGEPVEAA